MKIKFGLRPKFFIIFLAFVLVLSGVISYVLRGSYEDTIIDKYYDHAISIARLAASVTDGDRVRYYAQTGRRTSQYVEDLDRLNNMKEQTDVYYLYVMYPLDEETGIYIFDAKLTEEQKELIGDAESPLGEQVEFENDFDSALAVMETGEPSPGLDITTTIQGNISQTLASVYAPVFDSGGETVAFVGVDVNMTDVETYVQEATIQIQEAIAVITLTCFAVLLVIMQFSILGPVKKLKIAAENLADGKYGQLIRVRGSDEISEITRVFNRMSLNIQNHVGEINTINEAYHRYVPSRFFRLLGKESVLDTRLGDQRQRQLAVLNFNVIDFDQTIRQMSSEEMFAFINRILRQAIPDVVQSEGMIETFQDGGFTALYPDECEKALNAAVSICQRLNSLGQENRSYSVGIAYGSVMLGVVGDQARMSALSISQQTAVAGFLQKLAPKYYSHILITGSAASQIEDLFQLYHVRTIGYLYNTFTNRMEKIYDVYDGDNEEDRRRKDMTRQMFEKGVSLFCARKFYEARNAFVEVLKQFRRDAAAREYLYLCNQYYQRDDAGEIDIYIERF